jgi:hypothetical protein
VIHFSKSCPHKAEATALRAEVEFLRGLILRSNSFVLYQPTDGNPAPEVVSPAPVRGQPVPIQAGDHFSRNPVTYGDIPDEFVSGDGPVGPDEFGLIQAGIEEVNRERRESLRAKRGSA